MSNRPLIKSPVLWVLMLASIGVSVTLAALLDMRFDEAFTLDTTSKDIAYAFHQAIRFEQQAPLYFVVLTIWRNIDSSIFFARLFSVLCLPFIIWISAELARRYVKDVNPLLVAAVIALHQQDIWSSLDIRLYSMMLLFSGLLFLLFYDGYLTEKPRTLSRVLYVVVAVLSLYTQYYLGFQLVACAAALVVVGRWKSLFNYVLDMAIAGLFFIPMLFVITGQVATIGGHTEAAMPVLELVKGIYQRSILLSFAVDRITLETLRSWVMRFVILGLVSFLAVRIIRNRSIEDRSLATITAVLLVLFLVTLNFVGDQSLQPRHMSLLLWPLVLLPFAALSIFRNNKIIVGWVALLICLDIGHLVVSYQQLAKPGDLRRAIEYVAANEKPNQPILVFQAVAVLPIRHYYTGENKLVALPKETDFVVWDPRNNVLKDEAQVLSVIDQQPNAPEFFWLVHDGRCAHGSLLFNCQVLEDVIAKHFDVVTTQNFMEPTTVRLLRRK